MLHRSIGKSLLERHAELLKARAGSLDVVDRDGDVSESSTGVSVSVGIALEVRVRFRAMVVRQLQNAYGVQIGRRFRRP